MFHADVSFADLDSPAELIDGGIFLGASFVRPVRHRLLHTLVLESAERLVIASIERFADDPEGLLVERGLSEAALDARLAPLDDHPFEFAVLTIDRTRRCLFYRASPVVAIPVFLVADADHVTLDWDYSRLLRGRRMAADWGAALAYIAGRPSYGARTMVTGLYRAAADATLIATPGRVEVVLPAPVAHDGGQEVAPDADIEGHFLAAITALLEARPLERARTAVELSGGMDSALTSLAASAALGPGLMSIGAQFAGEMGAAQRARRMLLVERGEFDDLSLPAERYPAFAPTGLRRVRHGVWPEDENYPELFETIFAALHGAGIDALITGLGGDELYLAYEDEGDGGQAAPSAPDRSPFLTAAGSAIARRAPEPYPTGWLQQTCWLGAASQSQRVLRYGLWPVYPYHNVALARFVARLPYRYRRDRTLLRKTLTRLLGAPVFESGYLKERFRPVALRGMVENRDYLIDLVRRSPLARHPEIDDAAIIAALAGDIDALDHDAFQALFRALKLFCFFQSDDIATVAPEGAPRTLAM